MIDSHCHLDFPEFDGDRSGILERCFQLGIRRILIPGTQLATMGRLCEFVASSCTLPKSISSSSVQPSYAHHNDNSKPVAESANSVQLDLALGLHPYFLDATAKVEKVISDWQDYVTQCRESLIAIGEIGLDKAKTNSVSLTTQINYFTEQLRVAKLLQLPVIIHHRKTHTEIIQILKQEQFTYGGIIHAFSGSEQVAQQYCDLGFKLGVGGTITYDRAGKTRQSIKAVTIDNLLLETDAPDMPISGKQGQRNSPEYLPLIASELAKLKAMAVEDVVVQTNQNYATTFLSLCC